MKITDDGVMQDVPEVLAESIEERVARLEAVRSIGEAIAHYARCVDGGDSAGVASLFTEDGCLCGPGLAPLCGRARIEHTYAKLLKPLASATHMVSNLQVHFPSRDQAVAHCVLWAWEGMGNALDFTSSDNRLSLGRYEFAFVREADGQWRAQTMNVHFAGQTGSAARFAEHRDRNWPPQPGE